MCTTCVHSKYILLLYVIDFIICACFCVFNINIIIYIQMVVFRTTPHSSAQHALAFPCWAAIMYILLAISYDWFTPSPLLVRLAARPNRSGIRHLFFLLSFLVSVVVTSSSFLFCHHHSLLLLYSRASSFNSLALSAFTAPSWKQCTVM